MFFKAAIVHRTYLAPSTLHVSKQASSLMCLRVRLCLIRTSLVRCWKSKVSIAVPNSSTWRRREKSWHSFKYGDNHAHFLFQIQAPERSPGVFFFEAVPRMVEWTPSGKLKTPWTPPNKVQCSLCIKCAVQIKTDGLDSLFHNSFIATCCSLLQTTFWHRQNETNFLTNFEIQNHWWIQLTSYLKMIYFTMALIVTTKFEWFHPNPFLWFIKFMSHPTVYTMLWWITLTRIAQTDSGCFYNESSTWAHVKKISTSSPLVTFLFSLITWCRQEFCALDWIWTHTLCPLFLVSVYFHVWYFHLSTLCSYIGLPFVLQHQYSC